MILIFLISILLGSCRFLAEDSIQLKLPVYPQNLPPFPENSLWTLEYLSGCGPVESMEIPYCGEGALSLLVPKETFLICTLHPPFLSDFYNLHPAGGLFEPGENPSVDITWAGGGGSAFLIDAAEGGLVLSTINLRRLSDTILEKGDPDPWFLDWDLLGRQLVQRDMRSWYVRKKICFDLDLLFPEGRWLPDSVWLDPLVINDSEIHELELCEGIHSYLDLNSGNIFIITVDKKGEAFTLLYAQSEAVSGNFQSMGDFPDSVR